MKIFVILGSVRNNRFGEEPARWIHEKLRKKGIDSEIIDLRELELPCYDEPAGGPLSVNHNYTVPGAAEWAKKIGEADGYVWVSPEYNHGYPASLKNALDYVYFEWNRKPVSFVSYGTVGGARSIEQLRLVAIELQMAPLRNAVNIWKHWTLPDSPDKFAPYERDADALIDELMWWTKALKEAREK